jgi:hypothetical protein
MKRLLAILAAAALLLGLTACKEKDKYTDENNKEMILVLSFAQEAGLKEYPVEYEDMEGDGYTVEEIAMGLSELTGLRFDISAMRNGPAGVTVDWSDDSALLTGPPEEQNEDFHFYDYDSLAWFMLDSMELSIKRNLPFVEEVYYTMDGGEELFLYLDDPMGFSLDTPYMGSAFYFAHTDLRGDDDPVDPADVNWWGEYGSEKGMLHILNYNDNGMGWSFRFTLSSDTDETIEGVAALDPENPLFAEYMQLTFEFNLSDETIVCTGGDYGAYEATYVRTENAVG